MRAKSKILSILLSLVLVVGLAPASAYAGDPTLQSGGLSEQATGSYGVNLGSASYTSTNPYYPTYNGECTWYAWGRAHEKLGVSLPFTGNANDWTSLAASKGYATGTVARANSIMVEHYAPYGHVFFVESVANGYAYVSEGNYLGSYHEDAINLSTNRRQSWPTNPMGSIDYIYLTGSGHNPVGCLDAASGGDGTITVSGWAKDDDNPNAQIEVHVYVGGPSGTGESHGGIIANVNRSDVGAHGFSATFSTKKRGNVKVYAYGINIGDGENTHLSSSPKSVTVTYPPEGSFDSAAGGDGVVKVDGWALDRDHPNSQLDVHFYVNGPAGSGTYIGKTTAGLARADVNKATGMTGNHGFSATLSTNLRGNVKVYAYAINPDKDKGNPQISDAKSVTVLEPKGDAATITEATYAIRSKSDTGFGLDVKLGSTEDKAPVWLFEWGGMYRDPLSRSWVGSGGSGKAASGPYYQTFRLAPAGDGSYYIIASHSNKALEIYGASTERNVVVSQFTQNQSVAQRWYFDRNGDGTYAIRHRCSGLVVGVSSTILYVTGDGKPIAQDVPEGRDDQRFYLVPTDASMWDVSVPAQQYTGSAIEPIPIVTAGGVPMKVGTDYTVSYVNNVDPGTATLTVKGKDALIGSKSVTFEIAGQSPATPVVQSIADAEVSGVVSKVYAGEPLTQSPMVKVGSDTLVEGVDYSLSYTNNVNAGTAIMTISGMGDYTGTKVASFIINPATITSVSASPSSFTYDGKAKEPSLEVKAGSLTVPASGYVAAYSNNVGIGTAIVTVDGTGDYTGTASTTFTIADAAQPPIEVAGTPMHRLYNPNSGEHFYTAGADELADLVKAGWDYEGIAWTAPAQGDPVFRLYNPNAGDHHYTLSAEEREFLVTIGWVDEGVGWRSAGTSGVPLYRLYNPNATGAGGHHYTTDAKERADLVSVGWQDENVGWYGV